jgi:hypothetical protein
MAIMSRLDSRLKATDRQIRECNVQLELYRLRIAARKKNPALAEQAEDLLAHACAHLKNLMLYRNRLLRAVELEVFFSPDDERLPPRPPQLSR